MKKSAWSGALLGALLVSSSAAADGPRRDRRKPALDYSAMVVGSGKQPLAASDRRVDARTISLTPRRSGDDLLKLVPGLLVSRHGAEGKGTQIFLRGFDAAHGSDVEVLCDDIPVNELSNVHGQGYLDLGFIIPEAVRGIDVRKGSFDPAQGPFATAGSVRFDLGVAEAQRGTRLSYEAGSTARSRLLLVYAPKGQPEDVFVAAEAMDDGGYGQNRHSSRLALLAKGRLFQRGEDLQLSGLVAAYGARFGGPAPLPLRAFQEGRASFYDSYSQGTGGDSVRVLGSLRLRAAGRFGDLDVVGYAGWRRLALRENFTGYLLYPARGDLRLQFHDSAVGGLRLHHRVRLRRGLSLSTGAQLQLERIGQYEDQIDEEGRPWQRNRDLGGLQLTGALWASATYRPLPWLLASGGLRLDVMRFSTVERVGEGRSGQDSLAQLSPRLALAFPLPRGVQLFASYGRGLRPPEARSAISSAIVETDQISEYGGRPPGLTISDSMEAGARVQLPRRISLGLAGFASFIDNEVLFDHVAAVNVALNRTRRLGVEFSAEADPWPFLKLRLDATYVDARFIDSAAPVPGAPRFLATFSGIFEHPIGLRAGLRVFGLAPRPLRYGAIAGGAAIVDLLIGYRRKHWQLDLQIDNLLDYKWREGEFQYPSYFDRSGPRSELPALHFSAGPPITARGQFTLWI